MITGNRIRLRAPERSDIPSFVRWINDPEVTAGLIISLPMSLVEEEAWFDNMIQRPPEEHVLVIEAAADDGWKMIGSCGYHGINWKDRQGEVGILIGEKEFWGQGYGTEAMRLLVCHGFDTLNLNRVFLQVFDNNPRAIRSYEKIGFVHEGRLRQDIFKNGAYRDVLIMSILRSEWENRQD
jgi:diamine N-acetyltransferase